MSEHKKTPIVANRQLEWEHYVRLIIAGARREQQKQYLNSVKNKGITLRVTKEEKDKYKEEYEPHAVRVFKSKMSREYYWNEQNKRVYRFVPELQIIHDTEHVLSIWFDHCHMLMHNLAIGVLEFE